MGYLPALFVPTPPPYRAGISHSTTIFPHAGLTTLVQGAAELRGIPVYSERLSFLTLGDGIWTLTTACGDRKATTVIEVPLTVRGQGTSSQPNAAFWGLGYPGIRTYVFFYVNPKSGPENTLISCAW